MTIKKALKEKKRLLREINDLYSKIENYNVYPSTEKPVYDVKQLWDDLQYKIDDYVELKSNIHRSNIPVYDKIFKLSEYKNELMRLKILNTAEGKTMNQGYRRRRYNEDDEVISYHSHISTVERDEIISNLQKDIDNLQDDLDEWNAITQLSE